ncbi:MAG TPA: hypothetical protein VE173_04040, partial [Longimicrobiales bacterium]|nr:hypothetical protein [Longimicrobiales bacterium]
MLEAVSSSYLVPFDGTFRIADASTAPPRDAPSHKACEKRLHELTDRLEELQRLLWADDRYAV